jgi:hypothetical protein
MSLSDEEFRKRFFPQTPEGAGGMVLDDELE